MSGHAWADFIAKIHSFIRNLSRKKLLHADDISNTRLSRCLSVIDLTALGVGCTLGAGVYVVVGEVARFSAGPAVILSFLIAALSSVLSGLCYAEFGARVPKTGSAYIYSYVAVGELMAFITGWTLILQYIIGTSSVARAWSSNVDGFTGGRISEAFSRYMPMNMTGLAEYADPFAFSITMAVAVLLSCGAQESSMVNNIFTLINLGVICYVFITGLFKVNIANWEIDPEKVPVTDPNKDRVGKGGFLPFGLSGVISGAGTCFYCFVGFDIIATAGEEARNPQRAIPIAILACLSVCFVAYAAVSAVITLMVPYYSIPQIAPLPSVFDQVGWDVAKYVIVVGAVCALTTSLLGGLFPLPRIVYAMASDGLLFRFLGRVSRRFRTPLVSTMLFGLLAGVLAAVFSLKDLVDMMSIGTLFAYSLVALSVLILRGQQQTIGSPNTLSVETNDTAHLRYSDELNQEYQEINRHDGTEANTESSQTNLNNWTPAAPVPPESFTQYIKLCFMPERGHAEPTPKSEWITLINSYLLLIVIIFLNAGLIYFDGDNGQASYVYFVFTWITIVIFGCFSILLCISLARQPANQAKVSFKVPGVPWIPALSMLVNLHLMFQMSGTTWVFYAVWMLVGIFIYFVYGYWHSNERRRLQRNTPFETVSQPSTVIR
ncbi:High affinity cationic amino acid transporter 1 [Clonorchis sinensis]|uniref:High affinity cationic amino acid transporter 1 n=1 Tax=Clonorchis sinensis TaxID=79923 RepID=A0A8T1MNM5_CLOSI|nr:High affinity cationic amino acid transporter 1 [Clonorchis sinensis]